MHFTLQNFKLYDVDIIDLLWTGPAKDILTRTEAPEDFEGVFDDLQEKDLVYSIYCRNYPRAYSLLRKSDHILSPADAMAACLCALNTTPKLMEELLDHCPPIPEFQFQGAGAVCSLLAVAARYDRDKMLALLLRRGADPNGGTTPLAETLPLSVAFCSSSYSSLKCLLEDPRTEVKLTEEMLDAWGDLRPAEETSFFSDPSALWCCQLTLEALEGKPADLFDQLPVPPQLRLGHALCRGNPAMALRVCESRPLTDADIRDLEKHFTRSGAQFDLLDDHRSEILISMHKRYAQMLPYVLEQFPALLAAPWMRFAVASLALSLPEPDPALQRWAAQLPDGDIPLQTLPIQLHQGFFGFSGRINTPGLDDLFFARWDERLGRRLIPALDLNADIYFEHMTPKDIRAILERVHFTGEVAPDRLSAVPGRLLLSVPEDMLPQLLQPGRLLAQEQPAILLDACQALPAARRNLLLPYIRKAADYPL